jgi:predicted RNA polymerase sigma factor
MSATATIALVDHLFRRQAGQMVATLTRTLGPRHLTLAEDAVQEALLSAMQQWPYRGIPEHPDAWLFQVARNRALDRLRHARMAIAKEPAIARESGAVGCPSETINSGCYFSSVNHRSRATRAWRWP